MTTMQLVGTVGRDDEHTLLAHGTRQVLDELQRCLVGPLQILDDRDERGRPTELREQRGEGSVEPAARRVVDVSNLRIGPRTSPTQQPLTFQGIDNASQCTKWTTSLDLDAFADGRAGASAACDLDEPTDESA